MLSFLYPIAYYPILGKPITVYLGALTFVLLLFTAIVGYMNYTGRPIVPFKWHPRIALTAIIAATIHGLLAASIYF